MTHDAQLSIYLNDHLALTLGLLELARRTRRNNPGGELSRLLEQVVLELEANEGVLREVLAAVGGAPDRVKQGGAWLLEKLGRLKLNGALLRYSDLSRVNELQGLIMGIGGLRLALRSLSELAAAEARLVAFPFDALAHQLERHGEALDHQRRLAVEQAFAPGAGQAAA